MALADELRLITGPKSVVVVIRELPGVPDVDAVGTGKMERFCDVPATLLVFPS